MGNFDSQTWIEPLTSREIEILRLFAAGLSNREVAGKLQVSLETIKWYNKQIFSKLGVNSRGQALAKASEFQLLRSPESQPARDQVAPGHNLPAQLTTFVGRTQEIAQVRQLLRSSRLVVLTGAGGSGKTRLALQVANELAGYYRDGIWLVELAPLGEPYQVANAIAQVLNLNIASDASLADTLKRYLARRHLLLLMDNFEHLLDAAPLVGELLAAAPQLTVLATSRERLHVYGEQEYLVSPLALPDLQRRETSEQLLGYDAINLFHQRALAVHPEILDREAYFAAAAQICVRLDGLPLAIELAASQLKYFDPPTLARRIVEDLGALPGGPRGLPARQRTLRATIQWSYDLLHEDEKRLFARLSAFRGGGTLEAIESICGSDLAHRGIDALTALTDKNLVFLREAPDSDLRFSMLETVRQFARDCLDSSNEADVIFRRHAAYFTDLAETGARELRAAHQAYWYRRLRAEQDNLRSAMTWSLERLETGLGLRLVAALRDYWFYTGFFVEGRRWTDLALARSGQTAPDLLASVLSCAGQMAWSLKEFKQSSEFHRHALQLFQQLGDERNSAWCMLFLAMANSYVENQDGIEGSSQLGQQSLALFRKLDDQAGMAQTLNSLGEFARSQKDYPAAAAYYQESQSIAIKIGDQMRIGMTNQNLGFIAYHQGRYLEAVQRTRLSLKIAQEMKNDYSLGIYLASLAGPLAALGAPEQAARLLSCADSLLKSVNATFQLTDQYEIDLFTEDVRHRLGEKAFLEAWQAGQAMTLAEAVGEALRDPNP